MLHRATVCVRWQMEVSSVFSTSPLALEEIANITFYFLLLHVSVIAFSLREQDVTSPIHIPSEEAAIQVIQDTDGRPRTDPSEIIHFL